MLGICDKVDNRVIDLSVVRNYLFLICYLLLKITYFYSSSFDFHGKFEGICDTLVVPDSSVYGSARLLVRCVGPIGEAMAGYCKHETK